MKRLWISGLFLATLFSATLYNAWRVDHIIVSIVDLLTQAEEAARVEEWEQVECFTTAAKAEWDAAEDYFSVVLVHAETDEVSTGFEQVMGFLEYQDGPENDSSNGALIAKVQHLSDVEEVSWKNIL